MKVYEGYDTSEVNRIQSNCKNSGYKIKVKTTWDGGDRWGGYPFYSIDAIPFTEEEKAEQAIRAERNRKIKEAIAHYKSIGQLDKIQEAINEIKREYETR